MNNEVCCKLLQACSKMLNSERYDEAVINFSFTERKLITNLAIATKMIEALADQKNVEISLNLSGYS